MFGRPKTQTDVKKSTQKLLDTKKDVSTRLKHLKVILENADGAEAKAIFSTHYSHIYHLVYEGIIAAEASLKLKGVHRAQREELESVIHLLEKIIVLLPDLLHCRWQLHSLSRLMAKLNHPSNSIKLRREGMRLFLMWYQCLGSSAPNYIHSVYASLVPGLPGLSTETWPPPSDPSWGISPLEITAVIPASSSEKQPDDLTSYFLECLLDYMVSQAPKIHWKDGLQMWASSIDFLYERFKEFYLPRIFPYFEICTDIYKPNLDLPQLRRGGNDNINHTIHNCQVVFIKWVANYSHSVYRSSDCYHQPVWNAPTIAKTIVQNDELDRAHSTPPSSLSGGDRDSITSYSSIPSDVDANVIGKDVILGTRPNINLVHEVFRRALLMNFVHSVAIRRVIGVYKDWIQINVPELPVFMLEPEHESDEDAKSQSNKVDSPKSRLRTDSYMGAIGFNANNNREEYFSHLRAGAQKVLRVFFCNSASVFLLVQQKGDLGSPALIEEQVDICKRVLNIYRYTVMNTRMDPKTWEQLLIVMIHITSTILDPNQSPKNINKDSLGPKLAAALFQTLIVSWVKACLNVPISLELWDQLQSVLSQLSYIDDLITEWSKTMETLTRVLARHLYNLDLANLPLDRLSEQKAMKRALQSGTFVKSTTKQASTTVDGVTAFPRKRNASSGTTERNSLPFAPTTPLPRRSKLGLRRSLSEGNILTLERGSSDSPDASVSKRIERANGDLEVFRKRKISRSFDSIRRFVNRDAASVSQYSNLHSEWAEISSSTASLENTHSSIHMDGDSTTVNVCPEKEEPLGVILGGSVKGWLPSVAGVLWRRMLGVLGSPNQFINPKTHFHFFQVLKEIWNTLFKLKLNQCISIENTCTPRPSELVPPLTIVAPWCLDALELPEEYHKGKVLACSLLCEITLVNQDLSLSHEYLCKFYAAMHKQILINKQDVVNEIVRKCGLKFISKMLPGFSLLALDLIQAAHSVLSCEELKSTPRTEAATLLGSVLAMADIFKEIPVLKPNSMQFHPIQSQQTKDIVISCLILNAKKERTSQGRAVLLQSLTNYLAQQLMEIRLKNPATSTNEFKKRLHDILSLLLESIRVENRSVALVASDLLLFLSEFASEISNHAPEQCSRIILGLKLGLQQILPLKNSTKSSGKPPEIEKRLCVSLMLTLGEWCMNLPLQTLLTTSEIQKVSLISAAFEVYLMIARGYQDPPTQTQWQTVDDFDPHIPFDDLRVSDIPNWIGRESTIINPEKTTNQETETIKLAARTMMLHLMTQLGHFPISSDAERCGSVICENDDLSGISLELDEFNARVFTLPNLQMFTLDGETLVTMIELPVAIPDDSITSAFQTSHNQVRVIVRDLSGKACWDATHLVCVSNSNDQADSSVLVQPQFNEDMFYQSAITGSFFPPMGPRLTLRRRVAGTLPTVEDSADDLDNLDDLLNYIGHTSQECQLVIGEPLTTPWGPPPLLSQEIEDDVVSAVVNQRNSEVEYLLKTDLDPLMRARPITCSDWAIDDGESENMNSESSFGITSKINSISSSFLLSRRIFSQIGFNSWDKRTTVNLLNKDEKLLRELKHLDSQKCREVHKIAVIFVAEGQDDKQSILYNTGGSEAYEDFVAGLGWEVELETHTGFMGGLQRNKSTGETAPYYATSFTEVIYHVATRMPSNTEESLLQKTRHLGNDEVHIVWSEHKREYRRDVIPTEFCDVLIVIYPLQYGLFRVQIVRKLEVPYFGPLFNGAIVERDVLAPLVRATAINASRAKRCSLQFFQHHFQERAKSLSTIIQTHKARSTFEQFTTNVFSPRLPPSFQPRAIHRASATSFSSVSHVSVPHQLASALIDHSVSFNFGPIRSSNSPAPSISSTFQDVNLSPASEDLNNSSPPQHLLVPPVPPKRLGAKLSSALKPKLHTPPSSPAFPRISSPKNQRGSNANKN